MKELYHLTLFKKMTTEEFEKIAQIEDDKEDR
jgi:hypothetical protein